MLKKCFFSLFLISVTSLAFAQKKDTIRVFYLGGQSNMEGYGRNSELPEHLKKKFPNVYIFHGSPAGDDDKNGGAGKWEILQPGHGTEFTSDGKANRLSDRFGIELSFAARMQELYPKEKIALIKYARNGSSIDSLGAPYFGSWDPDYKSKTGITQYSHFLKTVRAAMVAKDINGDGIEDVLVPSGILWMQGESDANTETVANRYNYNLKRLMDLMRAVFRNNNLPIIIGRISDSGDAPDGKVWKAAELVQYAQEKFVKNNPFTAIIRNTNSYKYSDTYHYDSAGYVDFGKQFADAYLKFKFF